MLVIGNRKKYTSNRGCFFRKLLTVRLKYGKIIIIKKENLLADYRRETVNALNVFFLKDTKEVRGRKKASDKRFLW